MHFNHLIQLRLSSDQYQRYGSAAAAAGLSLSAYIRWQLEQQALLQDELRQHRQLLEAMRTGIATLSSASPGLAAPSPLYSLWVELLLLMRLLAGPDRVLRASRDVERCGLALWTVPEGHDV